MVEIKHSINWYLTKTNHAIDKISALRCPANLEEVRFQYSALIESIFSLIDYINDKRDAFNMTKVQFKKEIEDRINIEGKVTLDYMRNLRNSVVHRGLDISAKGEAHEDRISILTPDGITTQDGKAITHPSEKSLDKLLCTLEMVVKSLITNKLNALNALQPDDTVAIQKLSQAIRTAKPPAHMPPEVKKMSFMNISTSSEDLAKDIHNTLVQSLKDKLCVKMDVSHLP